MWDRLAEMFRANVLGGAKIVPNSPEQYVVGNDVLVQQTYYGMAQQQLRELDPAQCCCDNLVAIAARRKMFPRPARAAVGYVTLTGTPGALLSPAMQFSVGGRLYMADSAVTMPPAIPGSGSVAVRVVAQQTGSAGNDINGATTGQLLTSLTGVSATVTPCGNQFCNGLDAETCEQFRARYLERQAYKPRGRFDDIVATIMEFGCVTRVCIRQCECCTRQYSFELYPMFDNTFPNGIAPIHVLDDLQQWFFGPVQGMGLGRAPAQVFGQFFSHSAAAVDVTIGGLECIRSDQVQIVRDRVADLFKRLCPSTQLCADQFKLAIAQVVGNACSSTVDLTPAAGAVGLTVSACGDIVPECDVLPIVGTINIPTQVC